MEILKQWGPYAPLLLYLWADLPFLVCAIKLFKFGLTRMAINYLLVSLVISFMGFTEYRSYSSDDFSNYYRIWIGEYGTFGLLLLLLWLFFVFILLFFKENISEKSYLYPGNALFFRNPLIIGDLVAPPTRKNRVKLTTKFVMPGLARLTAVGMVTLAIMALFICGIGMRTCGWLDSAINYSGCVRQLEDNESHTTINYSPNGKLLAYGGLKGNYRIIDTSNYSVFDSAIGRSYAVKKVAFSPGGNLLVESDSQGVVGFFKIEGKIVYLSNDIEIPLEKETTQHLDFALSPDGSLIATASENTSVKIWNIKNRSLQREFPSNGSVVAFSPDGTLVAAETPDTNIALWRVADGTLLRTLTSNSKYRASVLAFSPDGSVLVAGNNSLNIWRVSDGILLRTLSDFENGINGLAFSPAGNRLVTSTMPYYEDNDDSDYLTVWDPNTGQQLKRWKDSGAATYGLAFSPDGKTLAAAGIDAVRVWRIT